MFACLRINKTVASPAARLTTGLLGFALTGRDLHPLDDSSHFQRYRLLLPKEPALTGRIQAPELLISKSGGGRTKVENKLDCPPTPLKRTSSGG